MVKQYRKILTIAGSDSGGGAGIQADIKAISACGGYAMSVVTAITVQNTQGVRGVHVVPADVVEAQIEAVLEDIGADAVKLGMLPTVETVEAVARQLQRFGIRNVVLDPVMVSTSGDRLTGEAAVEALIDRLFPLAALVTPNLPEASFITGIKIGSETDFPAAAASFRALGATAVLFKTGHFGSGKLNDTLFTSGERYTYGYHRIDTPNTHGTGCTLSSAIAAYLAQGCILHEAVGLAGDYLHKALLNGAGYTLGQGHGPVHHFYAWWTDET